MSDRIAEIKARCEAATPGPWHTNEIGKATVSRIIEMCDGVKMEGSDYRKEKLK